MRGSMYVEWMVELFALLETNEQKFLVHLYVAVLIKTF